MTTPPSHPQRPHPGDALRASRPSAAAASEGEYPPAAVDATTPLPVRGRTVPLIVGMAAAAAARRAAQGRLTAHRAVTPASGAWAAVPAVSVPPAAPPPAVPPAYPTPATPEAPALYPAPPPAAHTAPTASASVPAAPLPPIYPPAQTAATAALPTTPARPAKPTTAPIPVVPAPGQAAPSVPASHVAAPQPGPAPVAPVAQVSPPVAAIPTVAPPAPPQPAPTTPSHQDPNRPTAEELGNIGTVAMQKQSAASSAGGRKATIAALVAVCLALVGCGVAVTGPIGLKWWGTDQAAAIFTGGQASCTPGDTACTSKVAGDDGNWGGATGEPITVALGGDSNAVGGSARISTVGLGAVGELLQRADIAMVNLETAIGTNRAAAKPKTYTFMAPPSYLDTLHQVGIDVVTGANNHGMDFGQDGLAQTLAARTGDRPALIGLGSNADEAYRPWQTEVRGRKVTIFAGNDVLDSHLNWSAGPSTPGMAMIKRLDEISRLTEAVRAAREADPISVIVVYLHAGKELSTCPTARQQELAHAFAGAGATVVAMSHAHVLQRAEMIGSTAVIYGLGNFVFESYRPATRPSGVAEISIPAHGDPIVTWHAASITGGLPQLLDGAAATRAVHAWERLPGCGSTGVPIVSGRGPSDADVSDITHSTPFTPQAPSGAARSQRFDQRTDAVRSDASEPTRPGGAHR